MTTGGAGDFLQRTLRNLGVKGPPTGGATSEERADQALEKLAASNPERAAAVGEAQASRGRRRRKKPPARGPEEQLAALTSAPVPFPRPIYIGFQIQTNYARARDALLAAWDALRREYAGTERLRYALEYVRYLMEDIRKARLLALSLEARRVEMEKKIAESRQRGLEQAERFLAEVEAGEREATERQLRGQQARIDEAVRVATRRSLGERFALQMGIEPGPLTYIDIAEEAQEYLVILGAARDRLTEEFPMLGGI